MSGLETQGVLLSLDLRAIDEHGKNTANTSPSITEVRHYIMKRKRAAIPDDECDNVLLKSLKRSVADLLEKSRLSTSPSTTKKATRDSSAEHIWKEYRGRLASFSITGQLSRPKELTPVVFAKHGWSSEVDGDGELLRCDTCKGMLCVSLPSPTSLSARVYNANIRNIQRKLTESHDLNCKWRSKELAIASVYDIRQRYSQLKESEIGAVPLVENLLEIRWPDSKAVVSQNLRDCCDRFSLLSAICGWAPSSGTKDRMECRLCGRDLCLLVFSEENPLDLLEQHHSYCPVVDSTFPLWKESLASVTGDNRESKEKESIAGSVSRIKGLFRSMAQRK